ncbi:hypothetical protein D3C84_652070 [compost metagenome]
MLFKIGAHAADRFQTCLGFLPLEPGQNRSHAPGVEILRYTDAQDFQINLAGQCFDGLRRQRQQAPGIVNQQFAMLGDADVLPGAIAQ